jgi:cytochrome P450
MPIKIVIRFHRGMTRPFFSREVSHLFYYFASQINSTAQRIGHFDIFERNADEAIRQLKERLREGHDVDFQDLISRFTLDSATEFLFGSNVKSLSAGLPYPHTSPLSKTKNSHPANVFADAFIEAQILTSFRIRFGLSWPLREFWRDKVKRPRAIIDSFIDPILAEAVANKRAAGKTEINGDREVKDGESLLDHLVNYTDDQTILKDEILNIMIAGRDTTASTLTFAVYLLIQHPNVLERLREEILRVTGGFQRPTYENLREMKLLRAVLNETLRLYPAV